MLCFVRVLKKKGRSFAEPETADGFTRTEKAADIGDDEENRMEGPVHTFPEGPRNRTRHPENGGAPRPSAENGNGEPSVAESGARERGHSGVPQQYDRRANEGPRVQL